MGHAFIYHLYKSPWKCSQKKQPQTRLLWGALTCVLFWSKLEQAVQGAYGGRRWRGGGVSLACSCWGSGDRFCVLRSASAAESRISHAVSRSSCPLHNLPGLNAETGGVARRRLHTRTQVICRALIWNVLTKWRSRAKIKGKGWPWT
jgi:hypothetical protein